MASSGYYEKNKITLMEVDKYTKIMRVEKNGGNLNGLIQYFIEFNCKRLPIPKNVFIEYLDSEFYEIKNLTEYRYLDDNYRTFSIYEED